jgi:hypothetical protein
MVLSVAQTKYCQKIPGLNLDTATLKVLSLFPEWLCLGRVWDYFDCTTVLNDD